MKITKLKMSMAAVGLSLALALTGCGAQAPTGESEAETYKIGIVQFAEHGSLDNCREGFLEGLAEEGFKEGENLEVDYQNARADIAVANQIAQSFVSGKSDLILGIATPAAQSAYNAAQGKNIPVVFSAVSDPVSAGISNEEGLGNGISGTADRLPVEAQLQMIREVMPEAKKIGILYTTSEANSIYNLETYKNLADKYGFEIVEQGISKQADVPLALDSLLTKVDCLSNLTDNTVVQALPMVLEKANEKKVPVFGSEVEQVENGCLATMGLDYVALGKATGKIAARALNGEDLSTIPFEEFLDSELTINSEVAASLGIAFPESIVSRAVLDVSNQ